jgi:GntR family transcriptional regulator
MDPIYQKIVLDIQNKVKAGIYKAGERLPPERQLAIDYDVNRMTVRHALGVLVTQGTLYKEQGRGNFVSTMQVFQENLNSFTETLKKRGLEPATRVLEFATVYNLKEISRKMELSVEEEFYKLKRLRYANELPVAIETVYLPKKHYVGLQCFDMKTSLYQILHEHYQVEISKVSSEIDACIANRILMEIFGLQKPTALLKVAGIAYNKEGKKLFYEESYYRPDLYKYQVDIKR